MVEFTAASLAWTGGNGALAVAAGWSEALAVGWPDSWCEFWPVARCGTRLARRTAGWGTCGRVTWESRVGYLTPVFALAWRLLLAEVRISDAGLLMAGLLVVLTADVLTERGGERWLGRRVLRRCARDVRILPGPDGRAFLNLR